MEIECSSIRRRVAFDKARGRTTSEAQKDYIRRTHNCDACVAWRLQQAARRAS